MPLRFLVQALNYFAHEVMVPRLANSPFFQRFVVKTNQSLKNLQDVTVETVQEKAAKSGAAYRAMLFYKETHQKISDFKQQIDNEVLESLRDGSKSTQITKKDPPKKK